MRRLLLVCLFLTMPAVADSKKPGDDKPEPGTKGKGQSDPDPVVKLKHELDELKRQQSELAKKLADAEARLKAEEEKAVGTARLTVTGVLRVDKVERYWVAVRGSGLRERKVFVAGKPEQLKPLEKWVGQRVSVTGDLVVNPTDPLHHASWLVADKDYHGVGAGEMGVVNFTVSELPAEEPKGKGEK